MGNQQQQQNKHTFNSTNETSAIGFNSHKCSLFFRIVSFVELNVCLFCCCCWLFVLKYWKIERSSGELMTMSALCAFPPLIPAGGIYHHGASLADVSRSGSYASTGTLPVLESSNRNGYAGRTIPYASQVYPYQNCATASSSS